MTVCVARRHKSPGRSLQMMIPERLGEDYSGNARQRHSGFPRAEGRAGLGGGVRGRVKGRGERREGDRTRMPSIKASVAAAIRQCGAVRCGGQPEAQVEVGCGDAEQATDCSSGQLPQGLLHRVRAIAHEEITRQIISRLLPLKRERDSPWQVFHKNPCSLDASPGLEMTLPRTRQGPGRSGQGSRVELLVRSVSGHRRHPSSLAYGGHVILINLLVPNDVS